MSAKAYTRMVPRVKTRIGEVELECACGEWLPYPGDDEGDDDKSICPTCQTEWHVMRPISLGVASILEAAREGT